MSRFVVRSLRLAATLAGVLGTFACTNDQPVTGPAVSPQIAAFRADRNPNNVLSTLVSAQLENADSARVIYWSSSGASLVTPYASVANGTFSQPILGLKPATTYWLQLEAMGGYATASASASFVTGPLPAVLQRVRLVVSGATSTPGYILLSLLSPVEESGYVVVFDAAGEIVWYREVPLSPEQRLIETKQQPNGDFTVFVGSSTGSQVTDPGDGEFLQITPAGDIVRRWVAGDGLYTDPHELWLTGTGAATRAHLIAYDRRPVDISAWGRPDTVQAGHFVQRLRPDGSVEFAWSAWDFFPPDQWDMSVEAEDFAHSNSLEFDRDSSYIISHRNMSEIDKIDARTGAIIWRFGGKNSQFTILNDPDRGPSLQHAAQILDNGHLIMFDNGVEHSPAESRAVEYALDLQAKTATLVWEYRHDPPILTRFIGFVERYQNGNTLVAFGAAGVVDEVAPDGRLLWEGKLFLDGRPELFYRARRIRSLYEWGRL
ncbi:MAG: aryl-sulfate sulfotransferase [Gemmatimonadetes bacterium]|nr:aryl-sulfate sulfotransferase [Gemmatimonadota bacterium]